MRCGNPFFVAVLLVAALVPNAPRTHTNSNHAGSEIPCDFDETTLQFKGKPADQAKCLLRDVGRYGRLGPVLGEPPVPLRDLAGKKVSLRRQDVEAFLAEQGIAQDEIGGSLGEPLSLATLPNGEMIAATYFIIHDVSTPNYGGAEFPSNINEATWEWNDLKGKWKSRTVAHLFINRLGESVTAVPLSNPLPQGRFGTKFARDRLRESAKGLQIHAELIQPRRRDAAGFEGNDAIAPEPGFTDAQYKRLAIVYVAASLRRSVWLIPAFHAAIDAGIPDAHDDPQNFELAAWARHVGETIRAIKRVRNRGSRPVRNERVLSVRMRASKS